MSDELRAGATASPHEPEPDCAEVIAEVWTLLDGECTAEDQAKLQRHLEQCPGCLRQYGVEERIKALIARKCSGERAPRRLYERVRLQISQTSIIIRDP